MKDFYQTLGVPPNASPAEIAKRFRFLAHAYHPDKFASEEQKKQAEDEFKEINEANQILSNPTKRAQYDRERRASTTGFDAGEEQRRSEETAERERQRRKAEAAVEEERQRRNTEEAERKRQTAQTASPVEEERVNKKFGTERQSKLAVLGVVGLLLMLGIGGVLWSVINQSATATPTRVAIITATPFSGTLVPRTGEERVIGGTPMVFVPAGDFTMGSADADKDASSEEKPPHTVYLDAFWIDKFEVTNALYKKCVEQRACTAPSESKSYTRSSYYGNAQFDNYPVIYVSWDDALAYCNWAGKRLPTEAEREKATRGTDGRTYPWGNAWDGTKLNFCDKNCPFGWADKNADDGYADTAPVGNYPRGASPYGAMDMVGNVWEWVADYYDSNYYANAPRNNPKGPSSGQFRVVRGGVWFGAQGIARASNRRDITPTFRYEVVGFRCAE